MTDVEAIIRQEIDARGAVSFARYMELALYHPNGGYYRRAKSPFGVRGDFYTAENLEPVFGDLLARYISDVAASLSKEHGPFTVLELGSGSGNLRKSLSRWPYVGFEWNSDPLPERMSGVVIANEFFDALPVHVLERRNRWYELGVTIENGTLAFTALPSLPDELLTYAEQFGSAVPKGGVLEASLGMDAWIERVSRILQTGRLLVIDYGYSAPELARFPDGTLLAFRQHRAFSDVLLAPGTHDITAHVNFSAMRESAVRVGFKIKADLTLRAWLLSIWDDKQFAERWRTADERWRLEWKQLLIGMGETFRVVILEKRH